MRLASLTMQGFKSFPDSTIIDFHPGITAIVGPNGSGKSNVMEAVRWVLGEQSAKSLRGGKMEDVIFNGTTSRRRMGFAEVIIHFTDCEDILGESNKDIYVSRRYYRSGESEYLINHEAVRLKDINELFADTGIGKRGYSIISQGKVDDLLSESGDDRRKIFDEAAGIVKFKLRRKEAFRRLEEGRQNLLRSEDALKILTERERPLAKASEKLKRYLKLIDCARQLDFTLAVEDSEERNERKQTIESLLNDLRADRQNLERSSQEMNRTIEALKKERDNLDQEYERLHLAQLERQTNVSALREKQSRSADRRNYYKNEIERLAQEVERAKGKEAELQRRLLEIEDDLSSYKSLKTTQAQNLSEDDLALKQLKEEELALETAYAATKEKIKGHEETLLKAKEGLLQAEAKLSLQKERRQNLHQELERKAEERLKLKDEIEALNLSLEAKQKDLATHASLQDEATQALLDLDKKMAKLRDEAVQFHLKAEENTLTVGVLENAERDLEGYHESYRRLLDAGKKKPSLTAGLIGPLGRQITVNKGFETAIERALGPALHYLLVESKNDAQRQINWLKKNRAGRETFLPLDHYENRKGLTDIQAYQGEAGFLGTALDFVTADPQYDVILEDFLGRILIVETLDDALAMQQKGLRRYRLVTLGGELLFPQGSISGGEDAKSSYNLLQRRQRLEEAKALVVQCQNRAAAAEASFKSKLLEQKSLRDDQALLEREGKQLQRELMQLEARHHQLCERLAVLDEAEDTVEVIQLEQLESELQAMQEKVSQMTSERENLLKQEEATYLAFKEGSRQRVVKEQAVQAKGFEYQQILERQKQREEEQARLSETLVQLAKETSEFLKNIEIYEKHQETMLEEEVIRAEELLALEEMERDETAGFSALDQKRKELYQAQEDSYKESEANKERLHALLLEITKLEAEAERLLQKDVDEKNRLWEEYERSWQQVVDEALPREQSKQELKKQLRAIKQELKELGPVQPNAIAEYRELKERLEFQEKQREDITASQAEVERLIERLDRQMKERFNQEFEKLRNAFQLVFTELFQGGTADLLLLDPDDLDSAIEIQAQPPGKRLQSLSLLSGGERALTAIAVLFALFRLRPAPFAVLDEVESALDESNIDRFTHYLQRYTAQTQFVLITHRRGTMQACDRLYGISMKERGVSKLLSLALEEQL